MCNYLIFVLFQVEQRDVPGIDCAYLAMDTEEGVEVVWNEVQFSERKNFKAQEEKIQSVFDSLTQLEHPNIVKFHRYWTDTHNDKPRVSHLCLYRNFETFEETNSKFNVFSWTPTQPTIVADRHTKLTN